MAAARGRVRRPGSSGVAPSRRVRHRLVTQKGGADHGRAVQLFPAPAVHATHMSAGAVRVWREPPNSTWDGCGLLYSAALIHVWGSLGGGAPTQAVAVPLRCEVEHTQQTRHEPVWGQAPTVSSDGSSAPDTRGAVDPPKTAAVAASVVNPDSSRVRRGARLARARGTALRARLHGASCRLDANPSPQGSVGRQGRPPPERHGSRTERAPTCHSSLPQSTPAVAYEGPWALTCVTSEAAGGIWVRVR